MLCSNAQIEDQPRIKSDSNEILVEWDLGMLKTLNEGAMSVPKTETKEYQNAKQLQSAKLCLPAMDLC